MKALLSHVALNVGDMDQSVKFYCEDLGFREAFRMTNDSGEVTMVWIHIQERQFLELFPRGKEELEIKEFSKGIIHMCFEIEDIQQTYKQLREKGVHLEGEPKQGKSGSLNLWIRDPDGNRIEWMQILPDSQQGRALSKILNQNIVPGGD